MHVELIEGPLLVRTYREEDTDALYEAARESITEVSMWLPWCHKDYSIEESREFVGTRGKAAADGEWYSFGIFEKENGKFMGGVGLNFINRVHQMANLGYWVRTSAVGRGSWQLDLVSSNLVCIASKSLSQFRTSPANAWPRKSAPCVKACCESAS